MSPMDWDDLARRMIGLAVAEDRVFVSRTGCFEVDGLSPLVAVVGRQCGLSGLFGNPGAMLLEVVDWLHSRHAGRALGWVYDPGSDTWCVVVCPGPGASGKHVEDAVRAAKASYVACREVLR